MDRPDVRVVERGQYQRLALETGETIRITREGVRQHLQRHLTIQLEVARAVDFTHPAGAKCGKDFV